MLQIIPQLLTSARAYDLVVLTANASSITLSFGQILSARSFEYAISSTSAVAGFGAWTTLASTKIIGSLSASTQYWVKVRVVNGVARGPESPVVTGTTSSAGVPQTNLVHHWTFQTADTTFSAGTGSATDIIGGNNLTLTAVTSGTGRKAGQTAGIFNGTTSLGLMAGNPSITLNNAHAVFLNVLITTIGNAGGGGSSQSPFALSIDASNKLRIANDEAATAGRCDIRLVHAGTTLEVETTAAAFVSGTYINIGYSYDGAGAITVYVNGSAVATGAGGGFGDGGANLVGARSSPGTGNIAGQIDNVLVYSAAVNGATATAINAAVS